MSHETKQFTPDIPGPRRWNFVRRTAGSLLARKHVITSSGVELNSSHGPEVSVSNHRSNIDVPLLGWILKEIRTPYYPTKKGLNQPVLGWFLKGGGAMFFDRKDKEDRKRIFIDMGKKLDEGKRLHIFAEETRHNEGPELGPMTSSAVSLAEEHGLERIILAGIGGTEAPRNENLHVAFGEVSLAGLRQVLDQRRASIGTDETMTAVEATIALAGQYEVPALDLDALGSILNPPDEGLHTTKRKRGKIKSAEHSAISRLDIYNIFNEQVLRTKLQELVNIAWQESEDTDLADPA